MSPVPLKFKSVEWAEREHIPLMMVKVTTQGVVRVSAFEIISVSKVQPMPPPKSQGSQLRSKKAVATGRKSLLRFIGLVFWYR